MSPKKHDSRAQLIGCAPGSRDKHLVFTLYNFIINHPERSKLAIHLLLLLVISIMGTIFSIFLASILLFHLILSAGGCRRRRNSPPSPANALPFLGHLHLLKKPLHRSLAALSAAHGPVISLRLGSRPVLLVSSAAAAVECFTKNDAAFANRPRFLAGKHLGYNYTTLLWASNGPHWRDLRRIVSAEIFSSSRINSFAGFRLQEVAAMTKALADDSGADGDHHKPVELRPRLFNLTLNVIMRMAAGKSESPDRLMWSRRYHEIVKESFAVSGASNIVDYLPVLRWIDYQGMEKKLVKLQEKRDAFLQELLDERRKEWVAEGCREHEEEEEEEEEEAAANRWKCLIDVMLSLQQRDPTKYPDDVIKGLIVIMLSAGTETSALTVEWAMALLLSNPSSLARAQAELYRRVGHGRLVRESDLPNLPYLNSIIRETLRLHPVTPIMPAHESGEDCVVSGFLVPKGTLLLANAWAIHRDPALWPEPEAFSPERWELEGELGSRKVAMRKTMAFGMGRRGCPGEGMALRLVGLALGALVQCFEWDVHGGKDIDLTEGTGLSMPMVAPLRTSFRRRPFVTDAFFP
ncbi:Isoflavone 2'-hydroxylase [Apostasia shenzhenica]|uniref:Isoflavone 2'-hydroxylase n=1 Tax=Apostasia shenzhenica TaxID=1088818 RepID=A0A2I0APG4_9ASPA|nr:Isoflavone 2'-hydroxylase [Apostasia shenzhenica]